MKIDITLNQIGNLELIGIGILAIFLIVFGFIIASALKNKDFKDIISGLYNN